MVRISNAVVPDPILILIFKVLDPSLINLKIPVGNVMVPDPFLVIFKILSKQCSGTGFKFDSSF